jgi:hypothetical protein
MKNKTLFALVPVLLLQVACSNSKPPATTTGKPATTAKKPVQKTPAPQAKAPRQTTPGPTTFALEPTSNKFNMTPTTTALKVQPLSDVGIVDKTVNDLSANATNTAAATQNAAANAITTTQTAVVNQTKTTTNHVATQATMAATPFAAEAVRLPSNTSPAVVALLSEAEKNSKQGDLDSAAGDLERALRIDPRNSALTYKLAALRLKQSKPQMAEELASKAALLAGGDTELKRKSWLLVSEARRLQNNVQGAAEAKAKAASLGN